MSMTTLQEKAEHFVAVCLLANQSAEQSGIQHTFTTSTDWLFSATLGVPDGDCLGQIWAYTGVSRGHDRRSSSESMASGRAEEKSKLPGGKMMSMWCKV